jgi:hypothetical protein
MKKKTMSLNSEGELEWWGYLHSLGTYQAKRYFGPLDIKEANESPFCVKVVGPFMAKGRMEALEKIKELIKE